MVGKVSNVKAKTYTSPFLLVNWQLNSLSGHLYFPSMLTLASKAAMKIEVDLWADIP